MSYTPINWQTGDTITAEKLNKMDNGWSVTGGTTTICDETVTTVDDGGICVGQLSAESITESNITVTYDSTTYQCAKDGDGGYGDDANSTFSVYPFRIEYDGYIITETSGAHSVKIEAVVSTTETSSDFQTAVKSVSGMGTFIATELVTTWQQIFDAMTADKIVCVKNAGEGSVSLYPVITARLSLSGMYEVIATYADGGQAAIMYYIAESANSPIYGA